MTYRQHRDAEEALDIFEPPTPSAAPGRRRGPGGQEAGHRGRRVGLGARTASPAAGGGCCSPAWVSLRGPSLSNAQGQEALPRAGVPAPPSPSQTPCLQQRTGGAGRVSRTGRREKPAQANPGPLPQSLSILCFPLLSSSTQTCDLLPQVYPAGQMSPCSGQVCWKLILPATTLMMWNFYFFVFQPFLSSEGPPDPGSSRFDLCSEV